MLRGGRGRQGPTTQTLFQPLAGHTFPFPAAAVPSCSLHYQLKHFQELSVKTHTHIGSSPQDLPFCCWLGGGSSFSSLHSFILLLHRPQLHLTSCASQEHSKAKRVRDCSDAPAGSLSRNLAGAGWSGSSLPHTPPEHPDIHYSTSTTPQPFTDSTLSLIQSQ